MKKKNSLAYCGLVVGCPGSSKKENGAKKKFFFFSLLFLTPASLQKKKEVKNRDAKERKN